MVLEVIKLIPEAPLAPYETPTMELFGENS